MAFFFHVQVFWVNALIHNDKTFLCDVQKCNECNKAINKELFWDKFILRARSLRGHPAACAYGVGCIITHKLIPNHHTINSKQLLNCRDARSVRPACTTLISSPDVSSATRAVSLHRHAAWRGLLLLDAAYRKA